MGAKTTQLPVAGSQFSADVQSAAIPVTNGTFAWFEGALQFGYGYHQQVSVRAVRHERRALRMREVLLLLSGAD
jgi:hypothetical protein